jgi:glycosyltransferase involved in cell wall biosynthesis
LIYFCVPTHNEEKTVGVVLWKLRHVMAELPRDYQILVGDDASTDGCAQVLDPYRRVLPLVLMRNATRRGYAATLEMLLRQAVRMSRYPKRDSVVILQADFTDDLDAAADLVRRLESGADIAIGGPVAETVPPGFLERLANGYAKRTLAKLEWPENADPLNPLAAYRLICLKRALEESDPERLLAWDGRTANAALLRSALPHARRVECIEMTRHGERAQRSRRFRPLELVMNIRRFGAGRPSNGLTAVEHLGPDEVKGDLSVLHGPSGNGASTHRPEDAGTDRPTRSSRDAE